MLNAATLIVGSVVLAIIVIAGYLTIRSVRKGNCDKCGKCNK